MQPHDQRVIHSSSSSDWRTPPELFAALDRQFHFGLDAAATLDSKLCPAWLGPDHDTPEYRNALVANWRTPFDGDTVFINPPWSRDLLRSTKSRAYDIAAWAEVCAANAAAGLTVVGIFPFSHQTQWWQRWVRHGEYKAHEIREIPHRVSFLRPDGAKADNAGGNTAVIIWQPNPGYVGDWQPVQRVWGYR